MDRLLAIAGFFKGLPLRLYLYLGLVVVALVAGWTLYHRIDAGGYDRCRNEVDVAAAKATKEDTDKYLAALAWGNQISAKLAEAQKQINSLRSAHVDYAYSIAGTCPGRLRYLHDAAASGTPLPEAAFGPLAAAQPIDADRVGRAIAENYANARECYAKLSAINEFYKKPENAGAFDDE